MKMPFGKHKGEDLEDIPCDYLLWLVDNMELRGELDTAVAEQIAERGCDGDEMRPYEEIKKPKPEKTKFRDVAFSEHHKKWGWNCPFVDIDLLVAEYDQGLPKALIEYKSHLAQFIDKRCPSYRVIRHLADCAGIPFLIVRYSENFKKYEIIPMNDLGRRKTGGGDREMPEWQYVDFLYFLRGRKMPEGIFDKDGNLIPS